MNTPFTACAETFGSIHCNVPSRRFGGNFATQIELLRSGNCVMPATVNHDEPDNAWVCSPLTTYGGYALEELNRNVHPLLAMPLGLICRAYSRVLKHAGIDRAVALNNWLLSTNLYPDLADVDVRELVQSARSRWPQHALWFRSLNESANADWMEALAALGFAMIPSRQVYLFDDVRSKIRRQRNLQLDMQLLRNTNLLRASDADFGETDYARVADLYGQLYLEKYSRLNPQYTASFIGEWHQAGLLQLEGFRDAAGILRTVVGMYRQGRIITAPIVGYDTSLPQSLGLYRLLMACVFEEAIKTDSTINLSAGAANFKRLRGGKPAIEYSAVLASHLPASTRCAIAALSELTTRIGVPIMRRFKL